MAKIYKMTTNKITEGIVEQETTNVASADMETALRVFIADKAVEPVIVENIDSDALIADEVQKIDFTATATNGTVSPASFSVYPGTNVIFTAVPDAGQVFSKYTKNGIDVTDSTAIMEIGIAADGDAIVAVFVPE